MAKYMTGPIILTNGKWGCSGLLFFFSSAFRFSLSIWCLFSVLCHSAPFGRRSSYADMGSILPYGCCSTFSCPKRPHSRLPRWSSITCLIRPKSMTSLIKSKVALMIPRFYSMKSVKGGKWICMWFLEKVVDIISVTWVSQAKGTRSWS